MVARHMGKIALNYEENIFVYFFEGKGPTIDDVGVYRDTVFLRRYERELVLKLPIYFGKETVGGVRVERVVCWGVD